MKPYCTALAFLSRLPVPIRWQVSSDAAFARVVNFLPLAGLTLGAINGVLAGIAFLLLPDSLAAAVTTFGGMLINGALHEDGFADFFDAIGARSKDKRLDIMKDSHVGAFGALALIAACTFRVLIYVEIAQIDLGLCIAFLVLAGGWGRWLAPYLLKVCTYLHRNGKGLAGAWQHPSLPFLAGSAAFFLIASIIFYIPLGLSFALVVGILAVAFPHVFRYFLGGINGDCLGFASVSCEILSGIVFLMWMGLLV